MLTIMMLHISHGQEGTHGLKPAKAHCSLQSSFCCSVLGLYVGLSHTYTWLGWLRKTFTLLWLSQGKKKLHNQLIHVADKAIYVKWRPASGPPCTEISSAFFTTTLVSCSLYSYTSFTSTWPSPIFSEPSSIVGVYWSVTILFLKAVFHFLHWELSFCLFIAKHRFSVWM